MDLTVEREKMAAQQRELNRELAEVTVRAQALRDTILRLDGAIQLCDAQLKDAACHPTPE